jgi:hypothetical protein
MSIQQSYFTGIADAIRSKTGKTAPIVASNFAEEINSIEVGGGMTTKPLSSYDIRSIVHIPIYQDLTREGSAPTIPTSLFTRPWIVWRHGGAPNATYHGWGSSTFLIQAMVFNTLFSTQTTDISTNPVGVWVTSTFVEMFPQWVQDMLVQGFVPYRAGTSGTAVSAGTNGWQVKAFIPSIHELGVVNANAITIGAGFGGLTTNDQRAYITSIGAGAIYHTRSVRVDNTQFMGVSAGGAVQNVALTGTARIRPVIALPPNARFDSNNVLVQG